MLDLAFSRRACLSNAQLVLLTLSDLSEMHIGVFTRVMMAPRLAVASSEPFEYCVTVNLHSVNCVYIYCACCLCYALCFVYELITAVVMFLMDVVYDYSIVCYIFIVCAVCKGHYEAQARSTLFNKLFSLQLFLDQ